MLLKKSDIVCGKFEVMGCPQEGGQAYIYPALVQSDGSRVALKILRDALDYEANARFRQEVGVHRTLDHPNILKLLGVEFHEVTDRQHVLVCVLEWIEGGVTLQSLLDSYLESRDDKAARNLLPDRPGTCVPLVQVVSIMAQVASAIAYAHSKGFVHRDLKPSNILLVQQGALDWIPKVADFGIVKVLEQLPSSRRLTRTGTLGTPDYMSPEQGARMFDACNDIWSFWVMVYEMLTGKLPYKGHNLAQWANIWLAIRREELTYQPIDELVDGVPGDLQLMVRSGLNPKEDQRPSMAEASKMLGQIRRELDPTLGTTELGMVVSSSRPPRYDASAMTMDATDRPRVSKPTPTPVRIAPAEARRPKTQPSQPSIPLSIQVAVPKPVRKVVKAEAKLARISLDIVGPRTPGTAKPGKGKKRTKPPKSQASVIIPPSDEGRVSATSIPFASPVNPVIAYAERISHTPIERPSVTAQAPVKRNGSTTFVLFLLAFLVALGILTRERWMPWWQRYSAVPQETPTQTEQPAPVVATAPAVQTAAQIPVHVPAPVQTLRPTQSDSDTDSTVSPGSPGRPPPKGGTPRPAKTVDGPPVIEGLPPGAPPPLNQ